MPLAQMVVLNYGSQYTQLIMKKIRLLGVSCAILPYNTPLEEIKRYKPNGIILSGGPGNVNEEGALRLPLWLEDAGIPVLGICYGMQLLAKKYGALVSKGEGRYGRTKCSVLLDAGLMQGVVPEHSIVWSSFSGCVVNPGVEWEVHANIGGKDWKSTILAMQHRSKPLWAIQFHPEVSHTEHGKWMLENWLFKICKCTTDWIINENKIKSLVDGIQMQVGADFVMCAVSGGVDSMTLAMLLHKALGDRVSFVFVNNGLLREFDQYEVKANFSQLGIREQLYIMDDCGMTIHQLAGITDAEEKRKIIGERFIRTFESWRDGVGDIPWLAQGTLYPDVIESEDPTGVSDTIKTHHNVGGLPEQMNFKLLEPFRGLFKDEVRIIGAELGMPRSILGRHPFPGPGLAVRITGEVTQEKIDIVRKADTIWTRILKSENLYDHIWQAYAALVSEKTVGIRGDERSEGYIIVLRAVQCVDGMTAYPTDIPHSVLVQAAEEISKLDGVGRVLYDLTSKPPATIELI